MIKDITGYEGRLVFDTTKPDGTPRKLMDVTKLSNLGWKATIKREDGICNVYGQLMKSGWNE